MGTESNSTPSTVSVSTPTTSPSAKRSRDPEDEVYVDNLHSHKRYLSEVRSCFSIFNLPLFFLGLVLWDFCNFVVNVTYLIRVCLDSLFFLKKKRKSFMKICMRSISQMIKKIYCCADNGVQLKWINCWRPSPGESYGISCQVS